MDKERPDLVGYLFIDRAGMRLFLSHTYLRKGVKDDPVLYFKFACEFVYPDLRHN
jgi:hypothetical protein